MLSDIKCSVCGERMVLTPSGWLACPRWHGRLISEANQAEGLTYAQQRDLVAPKKNPHHVGGGNPVL